MPPKSLPMHGRDHLPTGSDPIPPIGGPSWSSIVTGLAPRFWWYFQDDSSVDGSFDDLTTHGHLLTVQALHTFNRDASQHFFNDQAYAGKVAGADTDFATATVSSGGTGWANGHGSPFSLEVWYRKATSSRGVLFANQATEGTSGFWAVRFDSTGQLRLTRYGTSYDSGIVPPTAEWHQYVVTGDGTTANLYYDGALVGSFADPTQTTNDFVAVNYENAGSTNKLSGFFAAIIGYDVALTGAQIAALYTAGMQDGSSSATPPAPGIEAGAIYPWQIHPAPVSTSWLETRGGAVVWATGVEETVHKEQANGYAGLDASAKLATGRLPFTGTPDGTKFLRDDYSWQAAGGGGGGAGSSPAGCRARRTTTQSINNITETAVLFDTEDYDTDGYHSTTTNTSRFTVPTGKAGYYAISASVKWASSSSNTERSAIIAVNGTPSATTRLAVSTIAANLNLAEGHTLSAICYLNVGDFVELYVYQATGAALNVDPSISQPNLALELLVVGATGPAGPGVPVGGATGQALTKNSGTDYDTHWTNVPTLELAMTLGG